MIRVTTRMKRTRSPSKK